MRRDISLTDKLKAVRRFTGSAFSAAKGYDLRRGMSRARVRTVEKYYEMLSELTERPHITVTPPKGAKREAFEFTGQKRHPRFTKAFVHVPDPRQRYRFEIDRTRPKGSRFVLVNRRTRERMWHIPADVFLSEDPELFEEYRGEIEADFFTEVIEEYGVRGEVYVIQAGNYHMWGAAGTPRSVGEKLATLFADYGAGNFDRYSRGSHWIGNWFRGVEVFGDAGDFEPYFTERVRAKAERMEARGQTNPNLKYRRLKNGDIGVFDRGRLIDQVRTETIPPLKGKRR